MKNLVTRAASGFVFAAVMIGGIMWHPLSYLAVMSVVLIGTLNEYYNITAERREHSSYFLSKKWVLIALFFVVFLISFVLSSEPVRALPDVSHLVKALFQVLLMQRDSALALNVLVPILIFKLFFIELFTKNQKPFENIGWNTLAVVYILVPLILTNKLFFDKGALFLVTLFGIIWFYDSACYSYGSLFGKHKLFERISPKKTMEGFIGGAITTMVLSFFIHLIPGLNILSRTEWIILTAIIIFCATAGDLIESLLKRSLHIKDSGSFMPGHGGFLDRFDAYLYAVPFVALMLWIFTQVKNLMLLIDYVSQ